MKMLHVGFALAIAGILSGCAGKQPQALTPGAEQVQIGKGDVVRGYQYLGEITAVHGHGCGLFGYRGNYAGAVANLRNQAYAMGANYVQIMSQTQPFPARNCFVNEYILEATAYRIPGITNSAPAAQPAALATPARAGQPALQPAASKEQQLQELHQQSLSYEEYQRRYREIMGQ